MKRIIVFLMLSSLLAVSCKKDYTCSCATTVVTTAYTQYGVYHPQQTDIYPFKNTWKSKEDDAIKRCKDFEKVQASTWGSGEAQRTMTETTACELY